MRRLIFCSFIPGRRIKQSLLFLSSYACLASYVYLIFFFSTFNRNNLNSKGLSLNLSTHPSDLIIQFICFGFYIDCGLQKFVKQVLRDYSYKSFNLTEIAGTVQTFVRVFFFLTKLNVLWKKGLFYTK